MTLTLQPHPSTPPPPLLSLEAAAVRDGARLSLEYRLSGDLAALRIPKREMPGRRDGLWRHSCMEAFVGWGGGYYLELNAAPSGDWAAYAFDAYREGQRDLSLAAEPEIVVDREAEWLRLQVTIVLPEKLSILPWQLGLSAVLEDQEGGLSYWALAHPEGRPDFHDGNCFIVQLPPKQPA